MKQLFVCHTQYNLILAMGISTLIDDLILFKDFNLTDELRVKTESHFNRCMFLEGNYPKKDLSTKEKLAKIANDIRKIRAFIGVYDRIFIVNDVCIQEMYSLKRAYEHNKTVEMAWLEDGANAYFSNGVVSGGMGATPVKRFIRKAVFSIRYGLFGFYDLGPCMGAHKSLNFAYVTFPDSVRPELKNKALIPITDEQFTKGMEFMYAGDKVIFTPGSILIAMDKLDVYGEKYEEVNQLIKSIVSSSEGNVYYKYHPRETDSLSSLKKCIELDRRVALESYLTNASTKNLTVIGIKSTALQTAKKMGYRVISLIQQIEAAKEVVDFYKSIGIECR